MNTIAYDYKYECSLGVASAGYKLLKLKSYLARAILCLHLYYDGQKNNVQWIEISGSQYSIEELDSVRWLKLYAEILTPISEKLHPDQTKDCPFGNGTYTMKVKLF